MKSRINTLKILAIASLVLLATGAFQSAEKTGTVSGIVTDAATHQPVQGASVIILGTKFGTVTSVSGEFAIKDVPVGRHTLQVSLAGFLFRECPECGCMRGMQYSCGYRYCYRR